MTATALPARWMTNRWTAAVAVGGLAAGALDMAYALGSVAAKGRDPTNVLRAIASGIFGRDAFHGGAAMAALGLTLHFLMTLVMAWTFVAAIRGGLASLRRYPLMSGPLYGAGIYLVMQEVVLPLSRVPLRDPRPPINFMDLAVHMFLVGLPIALAAYYWLPRLEDENKRLRGL